MHGRRNWIKEEMTRVENAYTCFPCHNQAKASDLVFTPHAH